MEKLSFVIPCYNSAGTIRQVVTEISSVTESLKDYTYEIIMVCDGSPDNVFDVIKELASENKNIIGIDLSRNFGQHSAMLAGYSFCTGDIIVDVDDDGELPLDELHKFLDKIHEGYDIVIGEYGNQNKGGIRSIGTKMNNYMASVLIGQPKTIRFTSYVVMRRYVVDEIMRYKNPYPYLAGLMLRSSGRLINVPVTHRERITGRSGYSFRKLMALWLNGFTAFSVKPLRIATLLGFLCAIAGFILVIYTVIHKLIAPEVLAGYSSLMAAVLFLGGIILLMLGMLGEYVGRIYVSINNSPQYVIREVVGSSSESSNCKE